jgi:hypothetical protein
MVPSVVLKRPGDQNSGSPTSQPTAAKRNQAPSMKFGSGPGLNEAKNTGIKSLINQISALGPLTTTLLESESLDSSLFLIIQQLQSVCMTCGTLLQEQTYCADVMAEEKRRHEIVIGGLPESNEEKATSRHCEDEKRVCEMFDIIELEAKPTTLYRMGLRQQHNARPRLLKVQFATKQHATSFLRNRGKITHTSHYNKLFIRESMTREQLDGRKILVSECNVKNDALSAADRDSNPFVVYANSVIQRSEIKSRRNQQTSNYDFAQ